MKPLLLLICFLSLPAQKLLAAETPVYYTVVNMPKGLNPAYYAGFEPRQLAEDLAGLLGEATGNKYVPTAYTGQKGPGIYLLINTSLKFSSTEAGQVEQNAGQSVKISARYLTGLSYAMYSWLQDLGFRFYLPGENWTKVPRLANIFVLKKKKIYQPAFRMRMFLASGGTFAVKGLDENKAMEADWRRWYRRNRMGCAYIIVDGHVGESFNIEHKKEIEEDPDILAPVQNARKYRVDGKLDPTHTKGVDMFSRWVARNYDKQKSGWPDFLPPKTFASADAGDGLNYCHTDACKKAFRSVSDQSFYIVNQAARKVRALDAKGGVSTLAYTERADTPGIRIEPNVHVMVVPTAFQYVSSPNNLVQRWAKKSKQVSVYEYLNIGVWAWDKPFFHLSDYHKKLEWYKRMNLEGIHAEASWSGMSSGILQYMILRYLCEPYGDLDRVMDEFCADNFGHAASPMKKILKAWYDSEAHLKTNYDHPSFDADELGLFMQWMDEAHSAPGLTEKNTRSIREMKAYLVYLCKYYELFGSLGEAKKFASNPDAKKNKARDILQYTWKMYATRIFHNTQLNDMYKTMLDETERGQWDYRKGLLPLENTGESWESVADREYAHYRNKYLTVAGMDIPVTDSLLESFLPQRADSIRIQSMDETSFTHFGYALSFYSGGAGEIRVRYQAGKSANPGSNDKVSVISVEKEDYRWMETKQVTGPNQKSELRFKIPGKGRYKLYLAQYQSTPVEWVIIPGQQLFYHTRKSIMMNGIRMQEPISEASYPNRYIAIWSPKEVASKGMRFSVLYHSSSNTSRFYKADGQKLNIQLNLPDFQVPPLPAGNRVIFYENEVYRWPPVVQGMPPLYLYLKYPLKQ